ncbi:MAG: hypothetical protein LBT20_08870, partial [Clostridiales bacterium]|nr:hypothetical protein [Clostridiales bacterium]
MSIHIDPNEIKYIVSQCQSSVFHMPIFLVCDKNESYYNNFKKDAEERCKVPTNDDLLAFTNGDHIGSFIALGIADSGIYVGTMKGSGGNITKSIDWERLCNAKIFASDSKTVHLGDIVFSCKGLHVSADKLVQMFRSMQGYVIKIADSGTTGKKARSEDNATIRELREKAEKGDTGAQVSLGLASLMGSDGVTQNEEEAVKGVRKAA